MQPPGTPDGPSFSLPSVVGPSLSYSSVDRAISGAGRVVAAIADKIMREAVGSATQAGQLGASVESKVQQYLSDKIAPVEQLHRDLVDLVEGSLAGGMAPAAAALEDLASAGVIVPRSKKPLITRPAAPSSGVQPGIQTAEWIQSGDASRGASAGALSAQEQELGVDPDIEGASITVTGQPSDVPGQGQGCPAPDTQAVLQAAQAASDALPPSADDTTTFWTLIGTQLANGACCINKGSSNVPTLDLPGSTEIWRVTITTDASRVDAAVAAAASVWSAPNYQPCTGGGMPSQTPATSPQPSQPPPTGPISGPPPPPPPPCCPEISIPPCPSLVLPECVNVDLCNWDQLCKTLTDCLSAAQPSASQVDDFLADWPQEEVDPDEPGNFSDYLGSLADDYLSYNSIDDALTAATTLDPDMDPSSALQLNPFGPDVPIGA